MASSGASGSSAAPLAPRMNPWTVPLPMPVTQEEVAAYNHAIDENDARCDEYERQRKQMLLAKLRMPEDVIMAGKMLTEFDSTNQLLLRNMKKRDDEFIYDPDVRDWVDELSSADAMAARNRGRIRVMKGSKKSRALKKRWSEPWGVGEAPGTPPPSGAQ